MKFWHYSFLMGALIIIFAFVLLWIFSPSFIFSNSQTLVSPLPAGMTVKENDQLRLLSFWFPFFGGEEEAPTGRDLAPTSRSVLVYDLEQEKPLYQKNPKERLPMASLTKIMTAIIALENPQRDDRYLVKSEHLVGEDSMGLSAGEILTQEELLYGLMLPSGNDASEVLAENFPGGRDAFIRAMNNKAVSLGLTDTRFSNPSGLQGDGVQYTTAEDLLVITKYALDNFPLFREIASTFQYEIPATGSHKYFFLENATNLISTYPGVRGVKTGFTPEAGLCLVTYLDYKGHKIIAVMLNSENRRMEMKDLLDYSLLEIGVKPPEFSG